MSVRLVDDVPTTLRKDARRAWDAFERGEVEWPTVLARVVAADQAREALSDDDRAAHDRWLFAEPMVQRRVAVSMEAEAA
jgi:hypothetical protein